MDLGADQVSRNGLIDEGEANRGRARRWRLDPEAKQVCRELGHGFKAVGSCGAPRLERLRVSHASLVPGASDPPIAAGGGNGDRKVARELEP